MFEQKAEEIINRSYKAVFDNTYNIEQQIENLYISVRCHDYLTNFNINETASHWEFLANRLLISDIESANKFIFKLLKIAKELDEFSLTSECLKDRLKKLLEDSSSSGSIECNAFCKLIDKE